MAHDAIQVLRTDEASFLAVMGTQVKMICDAGVQLERFAQHLKRQYAVEIDPLPATLRPGLSPKSLPKTRVQQGLLNRLKMLASHLECGPTSAPVPVTASGMPTCDDRCIA